MSTTFNANQIVRTLERGLCVWYAMRHPDLTVDFECFIPNSRDRVDMRMRKSATGNHGFIIVEAKRKATDDAIQQILRYRQQIEPFPLFPINDYVCVTFECPDQIRDQLKVNEIELAIPNESDSKKILSGGYHI
jgi:hypothetical protein